MLTVDEFSRGLWRLGVAFHRKMNDPVVLEYYKHLNDMPLATWDRVVGEAIRQQPRFPLVSELRKLAFQHRGPARGSNDTRLPEPVSDPVHAKESFALIRAIQRGEITGRDIYLCFQAMHARFPHYGWEEAVKDWEARHPEDVEA